MIAGLPALADNRAHRPLSHWHPAAKSKGGHRATQWPQAEYALLLLQDHRFSACHLSTSGTNSAFFAYMLPARNLYAEYIASSVCVQHVRLQKGDFQKQSAA